MTTSDNLSNFEAWSFRPTFNDSWISEAYSRDTQTLTRALHQTMTSNHTDYTPIFNMIPSGSSGSGSDPDVVTVKRVNPPVNGGRITKRKSRASKRNATTFMTVDTANFRQMVQQVTGIQYRNGEMPVVKNEPRGVFDRLQQGCLPTLDSSAFLFDHYQQVVGTDSLVKMNSPVPVSDVGSGFDFEGFSSFPTLESWKVM